MSSQLLFTQRFARLSEGSLFDGYDVVSCTDCGHCFADDIPAQSKFDEYYRDMSKYEVSTAGDRAPVPSQLDVERFDVTVKMVQEALHDRSARILEIGCATGMLLAALKNAGFTAVRGMDPSPDCARAARQYFDVAVDTGVIDDSMPRLGPVDMLVMIGVLEHIRDLGPALDAIGRTLVDDGLLLIAVPDASRYAQGEDAPFQEFSMEHINYFGPSNLSALLAGRGFALHSLRQGMQRAAGATSTPVLHAVFQKTRVETAGGPADFSTRDGLEHYVARSTAENSRVATNIDALAASGHPIVVWGAGTHTLRLLATSALKDANVVAIVDSNARYQGKRIGTIPVIEPARMHDIDATILISSRPSQDAICRFITDVLSLPNPIVTLYDTTLAARVNLEQ